MFDAAHVGLRLAQHADEGQLQFVGPLAQHLGRLRARVEPHAHGGDAAAPAGHPRQGHQLGMTLGRRVAVEHRVAHRDQDRIGKHHHPREIETVQAARRIEHDAGDACGRTQGVLRIDGPAHDGCLLGQVLRAAQLEPGLGRLLAVDVAEHHRDAVVGAVGRKVRGERALAASTFAVDDCDDGHGAWAGPARTELPRIGSSNGRLRKLLQKPPERPPFGLRCAIVSFPRHTPAAPDEEPRPEPRPAPAGAAAARRRRLLRQRLRSMCLRPVLRRAGAISQRTAGLAGASAQALMLAEGRLVHQAGAPSRRGRGSGTFRRSVRR